MPNCPKCDRPIDSQAIKCPFCKNPLKGFGHPGIPLYRAKQGHSLCDRCYYHEDDSCNYPQRPHAETCTMFHDRDMPLVVEQIRDKSLGNRVSFKAWCDRNRGLLLILIAIAIIILFVM